jgi:hypothetical protein
MTLEVIGPQPLERDASGQLKTHIGTIFPRHRTLVTLPGMIHAQQRLAMIDLLNAQRAAAGSPPLTGAEEDAEFVQSVDLLFEPDEVQIRPDPDHMDLAFAADDLLEEIVASKRSIRFLFLMDRKVRGALRARGECWRLFPMPQSREDLRQLIETSRVAIQHLPIYYYNRFRGTRYVTFTEFARLGDLAAAALACQLQEIAMHSANRNREDNPEVDFFGVDSGRFGARDLQGVDFAALPEPELRRRHGELRELFRAACEPDLLQDNPAAEVWRHAMLSALISQSDRIITEDVLRDLSPEFFMQVEWLPGGYFEEAEFVLDPIFEEAALKPQDAGLQALCDPLVRGFIFNLIREYGVLEYVNVGRIAQSLGRLQNQAPARREQLAGARRSVYIVELKVRAMPAPIVRFIRFQKWGVRERLDEGKKLLDAILGSEEYTDYVLDRRLGVQQLGMRLAQGIILQHTREVYTGRNQAMLGQTIPVVYFERDYLHGLATDKLPLSKYLNDAYARRLAQLLGRAAAVNLICGRAMESPLKVMFDDGDEVVMEDAATGLPAELLVSEPTGAFVDYRRGLLEVAPEYAEAVNARVGKVPDVRGFAATYLAALREEFLRIQGDYRRRRRAFDTIFKHLPYDPAGSFAFRWECVLRRLDQTDADALTAAIRGQIAALA